MALQKSAKLNDLAGTTLGDKVAEVLAKDLVSGSYKTGDMLPTETELAQQLSVSRASVASGLLLLSSLGMIHRQAGRGTIVQELRDWKLLDPLLGRWIMNYGNPHSNLLKEIVNYRYGIEPYVSALAAICATAQDLTTIENAHNQMLAAGKVKDMDALLKADIAFHTAIYRSTHNILWAQSINVLQPAVTLLISHVNQTSRKLSDSLQRHHNVLECIRAHDSAKAYDAAIHVLNLAAKDLGIAHSHSDLLPMIRDKAFPPDQKA